MQLFFREKGNPGLPPLILLHGLWGASENWLTVAGYLATQYHVILPDMRNHGLSPHSGIHNYTALAEDLEDFIAQLNLPSRPFIAGHSMGGKALMVLLLKRPEIVRKAAIIDICPKAYTSGPDPIHQPLISFINRFPLSSYTSREEIHALIREHFQNEELRQILFKNLRKENNSFIWKLNAAAISAHLPELMAWPSQLSGQTYPFPILFIRGEHSGYITPADLPIIHPSFPAAQLITIPHASHRIHADNPQTLAQTLASFFI